MAHKPQKDQNTKPTEADRTVRLPRKDLGLEKDEPTQALMKDVSPGDSTMRLKRDELAMEEHTVPLKSGVPAADSTLRLKRDELAMEEPTVALKSGVPAAESTLRLKRDELSFEEPTVALKSGVPAAESTLRLKRDELSLEEPTQALERPRLRTAMEVIDDATKVESPKAKPSVMMPDATDIPSWEETTQFFTPPSSGHTESKGQLPPQLEPAPSPVDPSDSMDETFTNVSAPLLPQALLFEPMEATSLMPVVEIPEPEEETLVLPDMHELDELPNAMKSTMVMPVMEAPSAPEKPEPMEATTILQVEPAPEPMGKTMVMPVMEAPSAPEKPEPMEATTILQVEQAPEPMGKTMVMPVMETPAAPEKPEPLESTLILQVEPVAQPAPAPMEKTMVMPMVEAPTAPEKPKQMEATTIMPVSVEDPSAYLTRQGQSPWHSSAKSPEHSPVSTQLVSESLLSKAKEATSGNSDSALAPVPPEVLAMEGDSPLSKAADIPASPRPMGPSGHVPERTVDTSTGMALTPSTLLMPVQPPLDPTVPIKRPMPTSTPDGTRPVQQASQPMPRSSQPIPFRPEPGPAKPRISEPRPSEPKVAVVPPSVPGYPDRKIPAPPAEPTPPIRAIASPTRPARPTPIPMTPQVAPAGNSSKILIPVAIGILLLIIGGIYFAFFRSSLKTNLPLVTLPSQTTEPSLPVPAGMQGTLANARGGDSKAMHMLGVSFYYGLNVPQNKAEGLRWMRKSAAAGNEKAKSDLRQMESGSR